MCTIMCQLEIRFLKKEKQLSFLKLQKEIRANQESVFHVPLEVFKDYYYHYYF
jgi:hypothetical protein